MNIKKVEKAAKKINQLLDNIKEEGEISRIEKDLLLSYIRDMYERVLDIEEVKNSSTTKESKKSYSPPIQTLEEVSTEPIQLADVVEKEVREASHVINEVSAPSAPASEQVPTIEFKEQVQSAVSTVTQNTTALQEEPVETEIPTELSALFNAEKINEISDRLGRSPIADLTRSMGINEKIFTVKELFGGNSDLFSTTMSELNKLSNLEQARDYLVEHVALEQEWASDSKIKKAATFVKLISRRY